MDLYLDNISLVTYVLVFLSGVGISFTPCIYPLIPIIMGVMGSAHERSRTRNFLMSLSYTAGVAFTFSLLGIIASMTGRLFGQIQSSPIAHLVVGGIIILFGLSLLDVISLPFFLLNRAGAGKVVKGRGVLSAMLMGAASGFVAAPCTAAVLGALLAYAAARQNVFFGFTLLFTFAMGLGVALVVIGTFTGVLASIPRSERITAAVQKIFAFGMILLGEYFVFKAGVLSV